MTEISAYAVFAVIIPASALLSALVTRITWLTLSARHVCPPADESYLAPPLPKQVNRQAARSSVLARDWRASDHQNLITQSVPVEQVGLHRLGERASRR